MPFKYNPPTRTFCSVCEALRQRDDTLPIVSTHHGKASAANQFQFHNWYNFVLGYSPEFPEYMLEREKIQTGALVVDPFMGSGTTLIACKLRGINSVGVDANDFMVDAARIKLSWDVDHNKLRQTRDQLLNAIFEKAVTYQWGNESQVEMTQLSLFQPVVESVHYQHLIEGRRPKMLLEKYISDANLAQALLIDDIIQQQFHDTPFYELFRFTLSAILVPISNIRYGPGFGVGKPRENLNVPQIFASKLNRIISDLMSVSDGQIRTPADVFLGDARILTQWIHPNTVDLMITSPPYPGDHEYTKHTRLELIFRDYATTIDAFQRIKKRMLRASTTNIYHSDNDYRVVYHLESIQEITELIDERLRHDGATSGFEKLYTRLIWEYFGGMYKSLQQCYQVLRPGGKIALLVSDSHAFKMVHIQTAAILQEIGLELGYINPEIVLWQLKNTTSHKYSLRENILILQKP